MRLCDKPRQELNGAMPSNAESICGDIMTSEHHSCFDSSCGQFRRFQADVNQSHESARLPHLGDDGLVFFGTEHRFDTDLVAQSHMLLQLLRYFVGRVDKDFLKYVRRYVGKTLVTPFP